MQRPCEYSLTWTETNLPFNSMVFSLFFFRFWTSRFRSCSFWFLCLEGSHEYFDACFHIPADGALFLYTVPRVEMSCDGGRAGCPYDVYWCFQMFALFDESVMYVGTNIALQFLQHVVGCNGKNCSCNGTNCSCSFFSLQLQAKHCQVNLTMLFIECLHFLQTWSFSFLWNLAATKQTAAAFLVCCSCRSVKKCRCICCIMCWFSFCFVNSLNWHGSMLTYDIRWCLQCSAHTVVANSGCLHRFSSCCEYIAMDRIGCLISETHCQHFRPNGTL